MFGSPTQFRWESFPHLYRKMFRYPPQLIWELTIHFSSWLSWWCCYNTSGSNLDFKQSTYINYNKLASMFITIKTQGVWVLTFCSSNSFFLTNWFRTTTSVFPTILLALEWDCVIGNWLKVFLKNKLHVPWSPYL